MATVFCRRGPFRLPWQFPAAALACVVGGLGLYRTLSHSPVWQPFTPYVFVRATSHEPHIGPSFQLPPLQSPVPPAAEPESVTVAASSGDSLVVRVPIGSVQRDEPATVASPTPAPEPAASDAPLPALEPKTPAVDVPPPPADVAVSAASEPVRPVEAEADGPAGPSQPAPNDSPAGPDSPTPAAEPSPAPSSGPGKSESAPGQNKATDKKPPKSASKPNDDEPESEAKLGRGASQSDAKLLP